MCGSRGQRQVAESRLVSTWEAFRPHGRDCQHLIRGVHVQRSRRMIPWRLLELGSSVLCSMVTNTGLNKGFVSVLGGEQKLRFE